MRSGTLAVMWLVAACTAGGGGGTGGGVGGTAGGGLAGSTGGGPAGGLGGGGDSRGCTVINTDAGAPYTYSSFCDDYAEARCNRAARCSTLATADLSLCKARWVADCEAGEAAIDAGVVCYAPGTARTCVSEVSTFP